MAIAQATTSAMVVVVVAMLMSFYGVSAHDAPIAAPAPGPSSTDCFTVVLGLADCLSYVQEGSNVTVPDKPCCPELKGLVDNNPICLCYLLANSNSLGVPIDTKRALNLPSVCKVTTPPPSLCSLAGYPVPGPVSSEIASPGPQPSEGSVSSPSPGATSKNDNGASSNAASSAMALLIGFAIAFLPKFF
ncbi:non-specific lipid transfer protein GPI-anchored 12 [Ziziphus jujuba]|uniref:Non-specific lipid transfer protein GPI-anchored 12 n=2 Tax=Ziziphus jujuba TaxID=326968 RepID=A0A6P3Z1H7_ZIZJJ|nr:non-specific lipid transfer protein GPI-anchored 12 [Ziziphus jujuba]KAH7541885.1 hypothetical protein FEM48_Zijuj02G0014800 [Ziziphus jujuba var. spinosa]